MVVAKVGEEKKQELISEYRRHETDTGSTEVQVALLTARILHLTENLKVHNTDLESRGGLLKMVGHRACLLKYLAASVPGRYQALIARLGLRR